VPAVACIPAVDGVRLIPDVLAVAGRSDVADVLGFDGIPAVFFVSAVALLAFLLLHAFLLLLTSFLLLAFLLILAVTLRTVLYSGKCDTLNYWTIRLRLSDCFFLLSDYRNIEYLIREFEKLSDIGSRSPSIGLSDIRHTKNNRLSSSAK
jgi:hypothetical protein